MLSYYLIAITANTVNDSYKHVIYEENELQERQQEKFGHKKITESLHQRAVSTLDAIKRRVWKDKWPLVTEEDQKDWTLASQTISISQSYLLALDYRNRNAG